MSSQLHETAAVLGKHSLKFRLEAYYSLVAPDAINDRAWRSKFEQIFQKYGQSYDGEQRLANKLAKKYGSAVRLLVARPKSETILRGQPPTSELDGDADNGCHSEAWYGLRANEQNSKDICFTSNRFDPIYALRAPENSVMNRNAWLRVSARLDTVAQFALHLPKCDPQRVEALKSRKRPLSNAKERSKNISRDLHPFEIVSQSVQGGPLTRLQSFRKQRVRITIRYVNAIRGELCGVLIAFDKHMNLVLKDAEEVYSKRPVDQDLSNTEIELNRRARLAGNAGKSGATSEGDEGEWAGKRRRMKNLMVRGDNIVSISLVSEEPVTTTISRHVKKVAGKGP